MSFQGYIDNIKAKTGKTPDDFKKLAEKKGLIKPSVKAGEIVAWLQKDFDLGHGHAMAIYATLKPFMNTQKEEAPAFPVKLAAPAQRALAGARITSLKELAKWTEEGIMELHGMGPNALKQLQKALNDNGLAFAKK